jgi:hypothetical protein
MQPIPIDLASTGLTTTQWAAFAIAGAMTLYALVIRPSMKRKKDPLAKAPSFSSLAQQRNVERQMQNLLVELSEMTRQITAQLDTRTQKLTMLIEEADQKIAQLQQLDRARPLPATESFVEPRHREAEPLPVFKPATTDSQHQAVYALADQGRSSPEIARELDRPRGEVDLILALRAHV